MIPEAVDLPDTEARAAAAREAAAALRTRLKQSEDKPGRRSAAERTRAIEAEAKAQGKRSPDVARALKPAAPDEADAARTAPRVVPRAPTLPPDRDGESDNAAPAPPRRRRRGTTEMLPPPAWQRHDLLVVLAALLALAGGALLKRHLTRPTLLPVDQLGLHLARPAGWLPPVRVGPPSSGLAVNVPGAADGAVDGRSSPHHVIYQSAVTPTSRLEVRIAERPATGNLRSALDLQRVGRHGESLWADESTDRTIGGRDWVRTSYRYAFKGSKTDQPTIARAIEYATLNGRLMYVVTVHGSGETVAGLEELVVPSLSVDPNHPAAVGRGR